MTLTKNQTISTIVMIIIIGFISYDLYDRLILQYRNEVYTVNGKQYIRFNKINIKQYLDISKRKPVSLKIFAKAIYLERTNSKDDNPIAIYPDCSNLDFSNLDLQGLDLAETNFSNCNFSNSNLVGTSFQRSNLTNVNFHNIKMNGTNFQAAILINAKFTKDK